MTMTQERIDWRDFANCRGKDTNLFFPAHGDNYGVDEAKRTCMGCPVREVCLEAHLGETYGIWGGASRPERQAIRKARRNGRHLVVMRERPTAERNTKIRELHRAGMSADALAERFGISRKQVHRVIGPIR